MLDSIALWLTSGPLDHLGFEYVRVGCVIAFLFLLTCVALVLIDVIRRPNGKY